MITVTEEDLKELERLTNLVQASGHDTNSAVRLCEKYKLKGCNICMGCPGQIRGLFNKIKDFYNGQK